MKHEPSRPLLLPLALAAVLAVPAGATTFTPTKFTDSFDGTCDADCSLREAIQAANANPGADTINLGAGTYGISIPGANEDNNASGDFDIRSQISLEGQGPDKTTVDAGGVDRAFEVFLEGTLSGSQFRIRNGAATQGAGLRATGNLSLLNCQVENNVATGFGGGVHTEPPGSFFAFNTAIVNNTAVGGGGLAGDNNMDLFNVTVAGNTATSDFGGGLYAFSGANVEILNGTFAGNTAVLGGGALFEGGTTITVANTVFGANTAPTNPDCNGSVTSLGFNLVGINSSCTGFTSMGDQVGTVSSPLDPQLGALANNGGGTSTRRPSLSSPLRNMGSTSGLGNPNACLSEDQRGVVRSLGGRCDIGAVEDDTLFTDGFESGNTSAWSGAVP